MAGIYGVFLKDKEKIKSISLSKNAVKDDISVPNGMLGRSVLAKLKGHRFLETKNGITICFEGLNLSDQGIQPSTFFENFEKEGIAFAKKLKGSYAGFVYDSNNETVHVFTDNLATKSIFYYHDKEVGFIFSSEMAALSTFLRQQNISYSLNTDAVYMMALYGFLLEDHTYVNEIKSLRYNSILSYSLKESNVGIQKFNQYCNKDIKIGYKEAIDRIDELATSSIQKNWEFLSGPKHLSLLSGGMDARTNVLIAKELGQDNISTITFGQSNSKDVKYARMIAEGEGLNHHERYLDSPDYLVDTIFENYVKPNDGLIMYHSSAHTSSTVRNFDTQKYNVLHTGQIGDALFGSFSKSGYDFIKNRGKIGYTGFISDNSLLDKITGLPSILKKYQELGMELFTYEQRIINATLMGDRTLNNTIDNISPFFDQELINLCLSLPNEYKASQIIYFDWLKKYHKQVLAYPWDKIDMLPNNRFKIVYGKKFKKYFNGAKKYFKLRYDSMNPYNNWLTENPYIIETLDTILNQELQKNLLDKEIKRDLRKIYANNIFEFRNKFAVVTALLAIKLHFED
ncbi:MAG: hypothetical protein CMC70_08400 [Flavobacteriaceae bacterium]|nr:hypothetical protein [Flavobacteriaceae bacterium]